MDKSIDQTISENFFKLLKEKNITNTEYADAVGIDRTLLSKWKNGQAKMTVEQINDAAKYFNVSIDYLYGKNNNNDVIKSTNDVLKPKKRYLIKKQDFLYEYKEYILAIFSMAIIIGILCYFIYDKSEFWLYLTFILIIYFFDFDIEKKEFETSPHIEININDKVYYTIDKDINIYYKKDIILYILKIIILIPTFLWLISNEKPWSNVIQIPLLIMIGGGLLSVIINPPRKRFLKNIEDLLISSYGFTRFSFIISLIVLCFSIILLLKFKVYILTIFAVLLVIVFLLSLIVDSKKYKDYYLVVKQTDGIKKVI